MKRTEKVIFTNMCMIYDDAGKVLVQDRINPEWAGITFPGGHVEAGESFTDAVIREVYEETGLTVSRLQMCGIKDWVQDDSVRYVVLLYKTNVFHGTLCASEEGEVLWMPFSELPKARLTQGMETMLKVFCQEELSEQFFYKEHGVWVEELK